MSRNSINILTLICLLLSPLSGMASTNVFNAPKDSVNSFLNEKVWLFTDRTSYIAGEKVLFSAIILNSPSSGEYDWSKVLYLELIHANGNPEVQNKYLITDFRTHGYLRLPENLLTGNYFLKAYTRWMQNFSSFSYAWIQIKVINPFERNVSNADNANGNSGDDEIIPVKKSLSDISISCRTDKDIYGRRDKVTLNLTIPPTVYQLPDRFCVSVIRPDAVDTIHYGIHGLPVKPGAKNFPLKFLPDIRGLSLSGRVIDNFTGQGVSQAHVRLSVMDKKADYSSYITLDNGVFLFALRPFTKTTDMYITVDPDDDRSMKILVDKEYANDNFTLLKKPFYLSDQEKETATEMMINFQIEKSYLGETVDISAEKYEGFREFFYGKPVNTIYIDDYIELPNIGEVIFELVPEVAVIRRNNVYYLRSNGYISDLEIYKPLIMIDNIPVPDVGAMLKMSPERIERIDVVDRIYAKGDLLFGGILNLISRNGDMAGIDLPENSYFFSFDGFVQPDTSVFHKSTNQQNLFRIPDVRNCLYWNPSTVITPGDTTTLDFYTTDRTGKYLIVVRGVTDDGTIVQGSSVIEVAGSPGPGTYPK